MYLDGIVNEIISQREKISVRLGRKFRLKRPFRPLTTKSLERQYFQKLRTMVFELKRLTQELLFPVIPSIIQQAESLRPKSDTTRTDEFARDILQMMSDLRTQFLRKYPEQEIEAMAKQVAERTEDFNSRSLSKTFLRVLGTDIARSEPWLPQEMNAFVRANVKLIKSIPEQYFDQVEGIVTRGVQSGRLGPDITKEIRTRFPVAQNKARLIARDQVAKFNSQLNRLRQTDVGIKRYQWSTSGDERVRASHRANDGKTFSWNKPPSTGHPGEDIQCRCVSIPIFE